MMRDIARTHSIHKSGPLALQARRDSCDELVAQLELPYHWVFPHPKSLEMWDESKSYCDSRETEVLTGMSDLVTEVVVSVVCCKTAGTLVEALDAEDKAELWSTATCVDRCVFHSHARLQMPALNSRDEPG